MAMISNSSKLISSFVCFLLLSATVVSAQTIVQQTTRTITAKNTASEDVYFIVRPSADRKRAPTKIKVAAKSERQIRYTGDMFDVWYSTVESPTPIQIGASVSFNNSSVLDIPVTPVTAMQPDSSGKYIEVHYKNVSQDRVAPASLLDSSWNTQYSGRDGNALNLMVTFSGDRGTVSSPTLNAQLVGVRYLNLKNGVVEVSGTWTREEKGQQLSGRFLFNVQADNFIGSATVADGSGWDSWNGKRSKK